MKERVIFFAISDPSPNLDSSMHIILLCYQNYAMQNVDK